MVLKCIWTIELNWVEKYGKMEEKQTIWALFGDMYRYMLGSGHFWPTCIGTPCSVFPVSTSFRILVITCSFLFRFE